MIVQEIILCFNIVDILTVQHFQPKLTWMKTPTNLKCLQTSNAFKPHLVQSSSNSYLYNNRGAAHFEEALALDHGAQPVLKAHDARHDGLMQGVVKNDLLGFAEEHLLVGMVKS